MYLNVSNGKVNRIDFSPVNNVLEIISVWFHLLFFFSYSYLLNLISEIMAYQKYSLFTQYTIYVYNTCYHIIFHSFALYNIVAVTLVSKFTVFDYMVLLSVPLV